LPVFSFHVTVQSVGSHDADELRSLGGGGGGGIFAAALAEVAKVSAAAKVTNVPAAIAVVRWNRLVKVTRAPAMRG
jgi:hypothetical protein